MRGRAAIAVLAAFAACSCGDAKIIGPIQTRPSPTARLAGGPPEHIAVVVMENAEYGEVIGSPSAQYVNHLARTYGVATRSFAISHPSLPNYLALTGGSTFGISSDCTGCSVPGSGLAGQLQARGLTWKAYMEDLPHSCFKGSGAGGYAKKHDPFMYYRSLAGSQASCAHVVPITQLYRDERGHALPRFIWVTPNLCHDMHDCSLATGDRFLSRLLAPLLHMLGMHGLLILTWDEGSTDDGCCRLASGGHIATIIAGPGAAHGARLSTPVDHYSVLQAIEDLFRLPRLPGAACSCTPSLQPLLKAG